MLIRKLKVLIKPKQSEKNSNFTIAPRTVFFPFSYLELVSLFSVLRQKAMSIHENSSMEKTETKNKNKTTKKYENTSDTYKNKLSKNPRSWV
jgi:hypothetical protein